MAESYGFTPDEVLDMPMYQVRALLLGVKGCQDAHKAVTGATGRARKVRQMLETLGFTTR